jgi:hypothetical protein
VRVKEYSTPTGGAVQDRPTRHASARKEVVLVMVGGGGVASLAAASIDPPEPLAE